MAKPPLLCLNISIEHLIISCFVFFRQAAARPPTRAWEVARTVVAPPSSVVKCLWQVFV